MKLGKLIESDGKLNVINAPNSIVGIHNGVFLAGSIEMGTAEKWQERITKQCKDIEVTFFNPRRDDWDSSWKEDIQNKKFREQVEWELNSMEQAEKIVMYFDPNGKAPISLLELGINSNSGKICVCCPTGFWKKGNVDIVCRKYNIPMVKDINGLVEFIHNDK